MFLSLLLMIADESDREFLSSVYTEYEQQMWFVANRILHDSSLAEDAVHNAFIGVVKNIKTVRTIPKDYIFSYLKRAVKNSAIDIIKKNSKEIFTENDYFETVDYKDVLDEKIEEDFLLYIISKIPKVYIDVMVLSLIDGYKPKEISKMLGMNVNTVRQHLSRGKKKFIEIYEEERSKLNAK